MYATFKRLLNRNFAVRYLDYFDISRRGVFRDHCNIITSAIPQVEIPNKTIPEHVFQNFSRWPHKTAVECCLTGKRYTYEEVRAKSLNLSKALRKRLNLRRGDVVALVLPNVAEFPICVLGALQAALTVTTVNPSYTTAEIRRQLVDSGAKAVITLTVLLSTVKAALPKPVPILTAKMEDSDSGCADSINLQEFLDVECDFPEETHVNVNDVALILYSSGTTGLPKGVELTHYSIVANQCQLQSPSLKLTMDTTGSLTADRRSNFLEEGPQEYMENVPLQAPRIISFPQDESSLLIEYYQDVIPAILPWFHVYGISMAFLSFDNGCKTVSLPKFTAELYIDMLIQHKPHILLAVPPIVQLMAYHPAVKEEHLQSIRTVATGAAPLNAVDEENFLKKTRKHINLQQGYGITEASPVVFATSPRRKKELQLSLVGSVGEAIPNTSAKVVRVDDSSGEPLGPNQPGELLVKGPQMMKGYHNRPKETEETFLNGWLRTGDLMYYDENKMFYVKDRLKELIKVKGFQVAPAELEQIITSHPDVSDAAVIGVPHRTHGEVPRAYIVTKPNIKVNKTEIEEFVAAKVVSYKQIKGGIVVMESIPRNAAGKIMRRELKLHYEKHNE